MVRHPRTLLCFIAVAFVLAPAVCLGGREGQTGSSKKKTFRVGMLRASTDNRHVVRDPLAAVVKAIRQNPNLDLLVGPEWLFVPKTAVHSALEFRRIRRTLERESRGNHMLIAPGTITWNNGGKYKNTLLSISDGKTLNTYSKHHLNGDLRLACKAGIKRQAGNRSGTFNWSIGERTYSVGVEICADHMARELFDDTRVNRESKPLDIHLLSSNAGFSLMESSLAIGVGGLFISNNGNVKYRGERLAVRYFNKEKPRSEASKRGLNQIDEYTGWHSSQIVWTGGKIQKQQKLTTDVDLVVYSIAGPQ